MDGQTKKSRVSTDLKATKLILSVEENAFIFVKVSNQQIFSLVSFDGTVERNLKSVNGQIFV